MKNIAFIINPFSSKGNYQSFLEKLRQKLPEAVYYISESIEGTNEFIKNHFDKTDIFVAVGGDGTISVVAKSLINTEKILAIFPAGSGNGFSNETNFNKNMDRLLKKIKQCKTRKIDTFTVNGNLSINVSGTGFDGKVVKKFEKTSRGFKNYIKVSIRTFLNYKPIEIEFLDEDFKNHNGKYLMINIANTRQFGNNAFIAPKASVTDGLVDIVLVRKFPLTHAVQFAYRMFTKNLKENRYVSFLQTPEITFSVNSSDWHLDGEYKALQSPVHVKIQPESLRILM